MTSQLPLRTVLVVEDDYFIADALSAALEEEHWHVLGPFPNVSRAIEALEDGEHADVAVLDVNLGGERVFPLVDKLKDEHTPIVLTTGYDEGSIPDSYTSLPRLQKPVPMQELLNCVNKLVAA